MYFMSLRRRLAALVNTPRAMTSRSILPNQSSVITSICTCSLTAVLASQRGTRLTTQCPKIPSCVQAAIDALLRSSELFVEFGSKFAEGGIGTAATDVRHH